MPTTKSNTRHPTTRKGQLHLFQKSFRSISSFPHACRGSARRTKKKEQFYYAFSVRSMYYLPTTKLTQPDTVQFYPLNLHPCRIISHLRVTLPISIPMQIPIFPSFHLPNCATIHPPNVISSEVPTIVSHTLRTTYHRTYIQPVNYFSSTRTSRDHPPIHTHIIHRSTTVPQYYCE